MILPTIRKKPTWQESSGFPRGIESIEKVLNFKIGFQDLEKVLNLVKMSLRYWKSIEIPNGKDQSVK